MDEFNRRLQTFFDEDDAHRACKWALAVPSAEDMEAKDDPYKEHSKGSHKCQYVESDMFRTCRQAFLAKLEGLPRDPTATALSTPMKGAFHPTTPTPTRKTRVKRATSVMSAIMTVADLEPQPELVASPSPMRISIAGAGMNMELTMNGVDTPSKKRRHH
ncbi:hypothetical protein ACHAQA_008514 [Verticillium albo-atrum]